MPADDLEDSKFISYYEIVNHNQLFLKSKRAHLEMTTAVKLICVDDDPICLEKVRVELERVRGDLSVRFFTSPEESISAHDQNPADIVISDLRLGTESGIDLIAKMRSKCPDTLYMLLSGDADLQSALVALNELQVFRFLLKPVDAQTLQLAIDAALVELNVQKLSRISAMSHSAVNVMRTRIIYLDEGYRIIFSNDRARNLLSDAARFDVSRERQLCSANHAETLEFHALLNRLRIDVTESTERSLFRFCGRNAAYPVIASVYYHPAVKESAAYYSVVLSNPEAEEISVEDITAALNILPSEARIVQAILEGLTVDQAAIKSKVSIHTARTYMRSIYEKTGVTRQSDLIRLLLLTAA